MHCFSAIQNSKSVSSFHRFGLANDQHRFVFRLKVDSSGYQPSLHDSATPAGVWQGSHPPPPPSQPYLGGRMPFMPPRELSFPYDHFFRLGFFLLTIDFYRPQHMRQFRPALPPSTSPEYRIYDLNKRLSMRTEVFAFACLLLFLKKKSSFLPLRSAIISGGIYSSMNSSKMMPQSQFPCTPTMDRNVFVRIDRITFSEMNTFLPPCRHRPCVDRPIFPHVIRRGCERSLFSIETSQGDLS